MSARKAVLIIEDDTDERRILVAALKRAGYFVHEAADAVQALVNAGREKPDLILLDIGLTGADAWGVAGLIRSSLGPDVQIAAHTRIDTPNDRALSERLEFSGYLLKPADTLDVTRFVEQRIGPGDQRQSSERRRIMDRRVLQIPVVVDRRAGSERRSGEDRRTRESGED